MSAIGRPWDDAIDTYECMVVKKRLDAKERYVSSNGKMK
jgi:hypothetical protein